MLWERLYFCRFRNWPSTFLEVNGGLLTLSCDVTPIWDVVYCILQHTISPSLLVPPHQNQSPKFSSTLQFSAHLAFYSSYPSTWSTSVSCAQYIIPYLGIGLLALANHKAPQGMCWDIMGSLDHAAWPCEIHSTLLHHGGRMSWTNVLHAFNKLWIISSS